MRHIPDGVLRRLDDEPLAVPDRVTEHLDGCDRCSARRAEIAHDTERVAQLFSAPRLVPDVESAWSRIEAELRRGRDEIRAPRRTPVVAPRARFPRVSLRAGAAIGAVGAVVVGTAAAASLTTIFSPTHVAALSVSASELRAIGAISGLGDSHLLSGFTTPTGSTTLRFGTLTWSSSAAEPATTLAQATADAGIPVPLPAHLPAGVGSAQQYFVQPRVTATVRFDSAAGSLAGSSVTVDAGPGVLTQYGGANGVGGSTLAIVTMRRPTAQSSGADLGRIEAFLLKQPGIPPELAEEVRLLGNVRTTLPVPVPAGADVRSVSVDGRPGVLLADSSNAAAGVIWEDGRGLLHGVAGILDSQDVLNVARQLG